VHIVSTPLNEVTSFTLTNEDCVLSYVVYFQVLLFVVLRECVEKHNDSVAKTLTRLGQFHHYILYYFAGHKFYQ
jgi:hypothetical protein